MAMSSAMEAGARASRHFAASAVPFTRVAAGNVATEDCAWTPRARQRMDIDSPPHRRGGDVATYLGRNFRDGVYRTGPIGNGAVMSQKISKDQGPDLTNVCPDLHHTALALLGAEVVKVETKDGDWPASGHLRTEQKLMGTSFLAQNCNKLSIT